MLGSMNDNLTGLVFLLTIALLLFVSIKLWVQWTAADGAAALRNEENAVNIEADRSRSLGVSVHLTSEGDWPQGGNTDSTSSQPQGVVRWGRNEEQKLTYGGCSIAVAGAHREPFAEVFFRRRCTRSENHTRVQLTLDQVDFGVRNCCTRNCPPRNQQCYNNCKTLFIYKMVIQVRPKSWAQDCRRLLLEPQHTAEVFGLQRNSNLSFQMPLVCPRQASFTYQTGNTRNRKAPAFGWTPACRDDATNSVSWTWELFRYANGNKLEFNLPRWGSRPPLGIRPSHTQIHPGSFLAEASWELQPNAEFYQERLEWDVKMSLHTAVLRTGRRLPRYSVTMGPILTSEKLLAFS